MKTDKEIRDNVIKLLIGINPDDLLDSSKVNPIADKLIDIIQNKISLTGENRFIPVV